MLWVMAHLLFKLWTSYVCIGYCTGCLPTEGVLLQGIARQRQAIVNGLRESVSLSCPIAEYVKCLACAHRLAKAVDPA